MRIIAAVDIMQGNVVRLTRGDPNLKVVYSSNPVRMAEQWVREGADMLHVVDLDATLALGSNRDIVREICRRVSIPVQVAGGLRDLRSIEDALSYAYSVVIGTLAYKDKDTLARLISRYGNDRIVVALDHSNGKVVIYGWRSITGVSVLDAVMQFKLIGVKRFLLTSIDRDGTMQGVDLDAIKDVSKVDGIEVIASGGIASMEDVSMLKRYGIYGVILGKALYENRIRIDEVKRVIKSIY